MSDASAPARASRWKYVAIFAALVGSSFLASHFKMFGIIYGVDVVNHGQNGVIVLEMTHFESYESQPYVTTSGRGEEILNDPRIPGLEGIKSVVELYPSLPSEYRNPADAFGRFPGYKKSLPRDVEVVWQLAELAQCDDYGPALADKTKDWMREHHYDPEYHRLASRCTWHPLPDKIFRKKLDMAAVRASDAYKRTGTRNKWVGGSRYTLNLALIFNEEQVQLEADNGTTNPWQ